MNKNYSKNYSETKEIMLSTWKSKYYKEAKRCSILIADSSEIIIRKIIFYSCNMSV